MKTLHIGCLSLMVVFSLTLYSQQNFEDAYRKSYVHEKSGQYKEAIEDLRVVNDLKSYEWNLRVGYLCYLNKQYVESENYYTKAIEIMPYSIEAKLGVILPMTQLNKWSGIKSQYEAILKIDSQNSTANYGIGYIYYNEKDYTKALSYFEKVVNLYPFTYYALLMDAWCNLNLGKYTQAKILFNKVLLVSPGDASAKDGLSKIK